MYFCFLFLFLFVDLGTFFFNIFWNQTELSGHSREPSIWYFTIRDLSTVGQQVFISAFHTAASRKSKAREPQAPVSEMTHINTDSQAKSSNS